MNTQPLLEALEKGCVYEPADAISATFKVDEAATDALLLQAFHAIIASQERERVLREALENVSIWIGKNPEFRQDILFDIVHLALQSTEQQG